MTVPSGAGRTLSNMCSVVRSPEEAPPAPRSPAKRCLEQLEREICELAAHLAAATCRWLLLVAEFDERGGWADWGARSCAHWLSARCGIGLVTARAHVRVARRLDELPRVREAFSGGELSYCKVRALVRVATPETEESLVEIARHATGAQLEKLVRGYSGALAATTEQAQQRHERRQLTTQWEDDGSLRLTARLAPEEGAVVLAALKVAEAWSAAPQDVSAESFEGEQDPAARQADALVAIARSAIADEPARRNDGDPT